MEDKENVRMKSYEDNNVYLKGAKNLILSGIIYFIGYMNWSISWIIIPIIISIFNDERKRKSLKRRNLIREAALRSEKDVILENIGDLPAWVYFPDIERAEWMNRIIKQLWPNVNHYVHDLITTTLEAKLKRNLEKYSLKGFKFQRVILGSVPFRIGGIIVYDNVSRDEIVMDLDVSYAGDCDIKFRLHGVGGGVKNFQLYGRLRVVLKPLIKTIPLTGGIQAFFLNIPDIDFDLDGIAGILEIPGINNLLKKSVVDTISSLMVLPNKFPIKLSKDVSSVQLKTPSPAGVLRVHVIEAKDLVKKDISFTGKGKSDPYTILEVGEQSFRTETIDCTVNPKWDYWCEFIILEFSGQQLKLHVWDEDTTEDETLGKISLDISNLIKAGQSDLWLGLEDVKHGQIHVRCTWLALSTDYTDLQVAIYETQQLQLTHISTALLIVYVDSATNLPQVKISTKPDPYVQIQIGKQIKNTKTVMRTINPVWEEGFIFFVSNPDSDALDLRIVDAKTESELCSLSYNISNLSNKENLEILQQPFRLGKGTPESKIVWSLHLKIFKNENMEEYLEEFLRKRKDSTSSVKSSEYSDNQMSNNSPLFNNVKLEEIFDRTSKSSTRSSMMSNSSNSRRRSKSGSLEEPIFTGQVSLSLRYSVQRQRLIVIVHSLTIPYKEQGKNLYVKVYLLPERNKDVKRKTGVMHSSNATFDERFEYLVPQGELNSKKLEISVIEEKMMKNYIFGELLIWPN
ncbi:extended synaptotagmin-2-like isoform X2 [Anoplophora glabripennis]|uniref:extended synaptotagmin-2-like isoform X2 n=1 Tax=Anoplophora glabripennis TaxID=217634 RepID=UPI000C77889F|nr:extended synaptotagmin-2-like isoform X2 [Anoplophora glabripennis]